MLNIPEDTIFVSSFHSNQRFCKQITRIIQDLLDQVLQSNLQPGQQHRENNQKSKNPLKNMLNQTTRVKDAQNQTQYVLLFPSVAEKNYLLNVCVKSVRTSRREILKYGNVLK